MLTKDELLEKGISEEIADEIISGMSDEEDNSLSALEKALNSEPEMESLFKAEEEEEEGEDEDYDEKFMKKHMKRYMKENKKSCSKTAKEVGLFGEEMKKAIDEFDIDSEGAVIEMSDLEPILSKQSEFNEEMAKAISHLADSIDIISAKSDKSFDLMQKAAMVQVEQAKGMGEFLSIPSGRKGVTVSSDMQKAQDVSRNQNKEIYKVLMKAVTVDKDKRAGTIVSAFESNGMNINGLAKDDKQYISGLLTKENK